MNSQYFSLPLSQIDRFGADIKLSFRKNTMYGTSIGGIYTILACITISFGIVFYGEDLVYRKSPQTIYSQESVKSPEAKTLNQKTFTLTFGVEDSVTWDHIIDPRIYTVSGVNRKRIKVFDKSTNSYRHDNFDIDLAPAPCTAGSPYFQVPGTETFFKDLVGVPQQYCITYPETTQDVNDVFTTTEGEKISKEVEIEGDFTADHFSILEFVFRTCMNLTAVDIAAGMTQDVVCLPQEQIDLHLQSSYIGMYFTNQNFDPNSYETPFTNAGSDLFWPTSNYLTKQITVTFKNTYVETNTGLFFNEVSVQKGFQFAGDREQLTHVIDNRFAIIQIRLQKAIQDRIFRKYKRIGQVIAEIGGIATFLRILGFILVYPISYLSLRKNLINELFAFSSTEKKNSQLKGKQQHLSRQLGSLRTQPTLAQIKTDARMLQSQQLENIQLELKENNLISQENTVNVPQAQAINSDTFPERESIQLYSGNKFIKSSLTQFDTTFKKKSMLFINTQQQKQQLQQQQSSITQIFQPERNDLQLSPIDYVLYYICPCLRRVRRKRNQLDYCNAIIDTQLDGVFILRKLLELDKLKALLLSETQQKLFNFIPKPLLNEQSFQINTPTSQEDHIIQSVLSKELKEKQPHLKQFHLLNVDHKSDEIKASEAFEAYKELASKQLLTRKERRILEMIHPSFADGEENASPHQTRLFDEEMATPTAAANSHPSQLLNRRHFIPKNSSFYLDGINQNNIFTKPPDVRKPQQQQKQPQFAKQILKIESCDKQSLSSSPDDQPVVASSTLVGDHFELLPLQSQGRQQNIQPVDISIADEIKPQDQQHQQECRDHQELTSLQETVDIPQSNDAFAAQIYLMQFRNQTAKDIHKHLRPRQVPQPQFKTK